MKYLKIRKVIHGGSERSRLFCICESHEWTLFKREKRRATDRFFEWQHTSFEWLKRISKQQYAQVEYVVIRIILIGRRQQFDDEVGGTCSLVQSGHRLIGDDNK